MKLASESDPTSSPWATSEVGSGEGDARSLSNAVPPKPSRSSVDLHLMPSRLPSPSGRGRPTQDLARARFNVHRRLDPANPCGQARCRSAAALPLRRRTIAGPMEGCSSYKYRKQAGNTMGEEEEWDEVERPARPASVEVGNNGRWHSTGYPTSRTGVGHSLSSVPYAGSRVLRSSTEAHESSFQAPFHL